jgi:large subunit ribosomal protein L21
MYAVIRAGGKQYRVAPGDVVKIEKLPANDGDTVEFNDVLAVSGEEGKIGPGAEVVVSGQVVESGRGNKVLVFHFKRKKQYKKILGHRQHYTAVRITEIAFDGQRFIAPELPPRKPKAAPPVETETDAVDGESAAPQAKAAAPKKGAAKKPARKPKAAKKTAKKDGSSKNKKKR